MKKLKEIIAFTSAAAITLTSAASCGKKEKKPETAEKALVNSYSSQELDFPEGITRIASMYYLEDEDKILISGYDEESYNDVQLFKASTDFAEITKLNIDFELEDNGENSVLVSAGNDGKIYACVTSVSHGDFETPDWDDENFDSENFDYEAYYEAAEYTYMLRSYDSDGKLLSENEIKLSDDAQYLNSFCRFGDDKFCVKLGGDDEETVAVVNVDGKIEKKLEMKDIQWINNIFEGSDGQIFCDAYGDNGEFICTIDTDKMEFSDKKIPIDQTGNYISGQPFKGVGDYKAFISMNKGLYGLKNDETLEEIVNWVDSDINSDEVSASVALANGDFIISSYDYENLTGNVSLLTKRDVSQLADTKIITLATFWNDYDLTSKVTDFNKSNTEYRIKIKDYSEYDDYDEKTETYKNTASKQLANDIISGNSPDMIYCSDRTLIKKLSYKGVFADLYEFMEKDDTLNKDAFLPNILSALEIDGKLYDISNSFNVQTYGAKTKYAKGMENWTLDQMIEASENLPSGMKMFKGGNSKEAVFSNLFWSLLDNFVDYEKKTCSFDSEEAKKLVEFCNTFPEKDDTEPDYDNMTDDEMQVYWTEQETMIKNDKALADYIYLGRVRDYARVSQVDFGEDFTFVGVPSEDGQGGTICLGSTFAILDDSGSKDAAWSFIRDNFFSEDAFKNGYEMPTLKKYFDQQVKESMEKPYYINEKGEKEYYDDSYYVGDKEVKLKPLTQEEADMVSDYILGITKVSGGYDSDVYDICDEELKAYFAGEKSIDETLKMIQNRVSILISEQN